VRYRSTIAREVLCAALCFRRLFPQSSPEVTANCARPAYRTFFPHLLWRRRHLAAQEAARGAAGHVGVGGVGSSAQSNRVRDAATGSTGRGVRSSRMRGWRHCERAQAAERQGGTGCRRRRQGGGERKGRKLGFWLYSRVEIVCMNLKYWKWGKKIFRKMYRIGVPNRTQLDTWPIGPK